MNKIIIHFLFLLLIPLPLISQVLPKEESKLSYRLIGFKFPPKQEICKYNVEIAIGNFKRADSFEKKIFKSLPGDKSKIIGEVPYFGEQYTWRIIYTGIDSSKTKSTLYHFSTLMAREVDTNNIRLRIITQAEKYKDGYVFLDVTRTLYDMKGNPVWFMPNINRSVTDSITPAMDLKPTQFGTLTYIFNTGIYEINYNGDTLWSGPSNNTKDYDKNFNHYHHEFTRLPNGHYMALGEELFLFKMKTKSGKYLFTYSDSFFKSVRINKDSSYYKIRLGTLTEYDAKGNIIWLWKSSKYLMRSDLDDAVRHSIVNQLHDNAFFFDEQNKTIYISFRVVSRIIKIKYPEGNVINTYGKLFDPNIKFKKWNNLFCDQHSCRLSKAGYLYLYNNNNCGGGISSIVMMKEPSSARDTLKKIWEYECTFDGDGIGEPRSPGAGGGNVFELPDSSIFCSLGYFSGKVFIVGMNKQIAWSALPEKWNNEEKRWEMAANYGASYRASIIIDKKQMEELIWHE